MIKKYALIGKNIQESLSPLIHSSFGCEYDLLDIEEHELEDTLKLSYDGFNITSPYKEIVTKYCDTDHKFVNTIIKSRGKLLGSNTDAYGFLMALSLSEVPSKCRTTNVGFIGNGAMAKCLSSLCNNSTLLDGRKLNEYDLSEFNGLVNCTPYQNYSFNNIPSDLWIMDLGYKDDTFVNNARANGNIAFNGFNVLYHQAMESQRLWSKYR